MKIEEVKVPTFTVGRKESAVAQIQASAKAFEILSGMYSDAPGAIVREIAANAWDAHKAAGCADKPFNVQVPNSLDPRFVVRDYGNSMAHEFVMQRLNTYFDSTKNDSNEEIGGFGLGIKSPLCYTNSFMIVTFRDGVRRVYAYQVGEKGLPEINLMAETPTTEPDGTEISIPVKADDYAAFQRAIKKTFAFYEVKPEIGGYPLTVPEFDKILEGDKWFICSETDSFTEQVVYIEMGGIAYPITQQFHNVDYYRGYGSGRQTLFLRANIGDVDVTPNREQTKMTDRTIAFIKDAVQAARDELQDIIQAKVDAVGTASYWDIVPILDQFNGGMARAMKVDVRAITFNGHTFSSDHFTVEGKNIPGFERYGNWEIRGQTRVTRGDHYSTAHNLPRLSMNKHPIIVMDGSESVHVGRWMRSDSVRSATVVVVETTQKQAAYDKLMEVFHGYSQIMQAHDLVVPKIVVPKGERRFYIYHTGSWDAVQRSEIDLATMPDTMYYFHTDGRQSGELFGKEVNFKNERAFVHAATEWLTEEDQDAPRIYYLTDQLIKKINKHRPDIELVLVVDELKSQLIDKIQAAAPNYFSRGETEIRAAWMHHSNYDWKVREAFRFWAKYFGRQDYVDAMATLAVGKAVDRELERMCELLEGKTIHAMFAEHNIPVTAISCTSFDELLETMPVARLLLDNYSDPSVLALIEEKAGWKPVATTEAAEASVEAEDDY